MNDYRYDNQTVVGFIYTSIFWGVVGILAGIWIFIQMWNPAWNIPPYFTYGRLRVVHTNILAFGLVLGALIGIFYYVTMRLAKRPLNQHASLGLSKGQSRWRSWRGRQPVTGFSLSFR